MSPLDFLNWAKANFPDQYGIALQKHAMADDGINYAGWTPGLSAATPDPGPVADDWSKLSTTWTGLIGTLSKQIIDYKSNAALLKVNSARTASGLPPVDASGHVVETSMVAGLPRALTAPSAAAGGVSPLVWLALAGGGAFLLMNRKGR